MALEPAAVGENTKRAYRTRVGGFLGYLAATPTEYGDPLSGEHARDYAARDYKAHLKTVRKAKPSSVNLSLAAIDSFCRYMGVGKPDVARGDLPGAGPGARRRSRSGSCGRWRGAARRRDRAMARVLFFAGLRVSELAGLDGADVSVSARKGRAAPILCTSHDGSLDTHCSVSTSSSAPEFWSGSFSSSANSAGVKYPNAPCGLWWL